LIEVQGLTKYFGARPAIIDLTFSVPQGQVLGFLGPHGAGKSTTMRILAGCLGVTSGTASIAGYDVFQHARQARRQVGCVPQNLPLYNEMRVEPYLETMCQLRGVAPRRRRLRIDYALTVTGLTERRRALIGDLESAPRRRVGLAQAVLHDPQVLIMDEPTAGLDQDQVDETRQLVSVLCEGRTVVLSGSSLSEVVGTCERALVIKEGKLVADDAPVKLGWRLSGKHNREVEAVIVGDAPAVDQRLRKLAGVLEVTMTSSVDDERHLSVIGEGDDLQEAVARLIVGEGLSLRSLNSHNLSMGDEYRELSSEEAS